MHSISDRLRAYGKVESCISACGILVLAALYVYWWTSTPRSLAGRAAALVSLVLFIWVCLRFVPVWVAAWRGNELPAAPEAAKAVPEYIRLKILPQTAQQEKVSSRWFQRIPS